MGYLDLRRPRLSCKGSKLQFPEASVGRESIPKGWSEPMMEFVGGVNRGSGFQLPAHTAVPRVACDLRPGPYEVVGDVGPRMGCRSHLQKSCGTQFSVASGHGAPQHLRETSFPVSVAQLAPPASCSGEYRAGKHP